MVSSPAALADLAAIADYIGRDNPTRARSFVAELRTQARRAARNPTAYRLRSDIGPAIRAVHYRDYMILYRDLENEVRVVRIAHGAQNLTALDFS